MNLKTHTAYPEIQANEVFSYTAYAAARPGKVAKGEAAFREAAALSAAEALGVDADSICFKDLKVCDPLRFRWAAKLLKADGTVAQELDGEAPTRAEAVAAAREAINDVADLYLIPAEET